MVEKFGYSLAQISIRLEIEGDEAPVLENLNRQIRSAFHMRFNLQVVPSGTLPTFEMKARRWNVIT